MARKRRRKPKYEVRPEWDARKVKALRAHLGYTQQRMSEELGTRQQTISEWETGQYCPRGATVTLLNIVAERAGFEYSATPDHNKDEKNNPGTEANSQRTDE